MVTPDDIIGFAGEFVGTEIVCAEDTDLLERLHLDGARAEAFFDAYSARFSVDAEKMLASFHYNAPGKRFWRRERPVGKHGKAFARIPITPQLLADAANEGHWPLEYPSHRMHRSRVPLVLMFLLLALMVLAVTVLGVQERV